MDPGPAQLTGPRVLYSSPLLKCRAGMNILGSHRNFYIDFLVCSANGMVVERQAEASSREVPLEASEIIPLLLPWPD